MVKDNIENDQSFWETFHISFSSKYQIKKNYRSVTNLILIHPVSEFYEFEPRLKSAKTRFQLSASLNLEKLNTILSGTNHI